MDFVRVGVFGEVPEGEVRAYDTPAGRAHNRRVELTVAGPGN